MPRPRKAGRRWLKNAAGGNRYVRKRGRVWVVTQRGTGKVLSRHRTKALAEASFRAMEMGKHGGTFTRRRNPRSAPRSEREAWEDVAEWAHQIALHPAKPGSRRSQLNGDVARAIMDKAEAMIAQLREGVHTNPMLAVFGNPPGRRRALGETLGHVHEVRYRHATDGQNYVHEFGKGDIIELLDDGSVRIFNPTRPLWKDFA